MIVDPKPYQLSTHFLYTIENSPMHSSREIQTSTNISEFEQRLEVTRSLNHLLANVIDHFFSCHFVNEGDFSHIHVPMDTVINQI